MKKRAFLIFTVVLGMFLSACSYRWKSGFLSEFMLSDHEKSNKKFDEVLEAINARDGDKLTELFSVEVVNNDKDKFADSVEELFEYFTGTVESYEDSGGCMVANSREYNDVYQMMQTTYEVITTEGKYRMAIQHVTKDTVNPNNIGVTSLYVLKITKENEMPPEKAYWGDAKFTPGINIDIPSRINIDIP